MHSQRLTTQFTYSYYEATTATATDLKHHTGATQNVVCTEAGFSVLQYIDTAEITLELEEEKVDRFDYEAGS